MKFFHYHFIYPKNHISTDTSSPIRKRKVKFPFDPERDKIYNSAPSGKNDIVLGYILKVDPLLNNRINLNGEQHIPYQLIYKALLWSHVENDNNDYELYKRAPFRPIEGATKFAFEKYESDEYLVDINVGSPNFYQQEIHDIRFKFQPKLLHSRDGYELREFDFCFMNRDEFRYLMNDIINNPKHEGNLVISGLNLELGEFVPFKEEVPRMKYFTLKMQAYLTEDLTIPTFTEISSPIHLYTAPCPPFWNPGKIPNIEGLSTSETCAKIRKFEHSIFPPREVHSL